MARFRWLSVVVWIASLGALGQGCGKVNAKCSPGQLRCGSSCVDPKTDASNCGACDNACATGAQCTAGSCGCTDVTLTTCSGACVDLTSDANNCAACGTACTGGTSCVSSACVCTGGKSDCGGTCVDLTNDTNNCGACGTACTGGKSCALSACVCTGGKSDCSGTCVDLTSDASNCGACGTACTGGKSCQSSACLCPSLLTDCSGLCVDETSDNGNCGMCGKACAGGTACKGSACVCPANQNLCSGTCFASNDNGHCGVGCATCTPTTDYCDGTSCVTAVAPTLATSWNDPTGWKDSSGADINLTFTPVTGATWKCRIGLAPPGTTYQGSPPPFVNCDGGDGSMPVFTPRGSTVGSTRVEVEYTVNGATSPVTVFESYIHPALNSVKSCAAPSTDAQFFSAAATFSAAHPALFPTATQFPALGSPPKTSDAIYLRNPFIKIPHSGIQISAGMNHSFASPYEAGANTTMLHWSLRHHWSMNAAAVGSSAARSMILWRRIYADQENNSCANNIKFSSDLAHWFTTSVSLWSVFHSRRQSQCDAFVVNLRGDGLCLGGTAGAPSPQTIDSYNDKLTGTFTVTDGSAVVTATTSVFTSALVGKAMSITAQDQGAVTYNIQSVESGTHLTLNMNYFQASSTTVPALYIMPGTASSYQTTITGYTKGGGFISTANQTTVKHDLKCLSTESVANNTTLKCNGDAFSTVLPP